MTASAGYPAGLPPEASPLTARQRREALAVVIARETGHLAWRRRRTPARSFAEYQSRWARQLAGHRWRDAGTLDEATALSSYGNQRLTAIIEFTPCAIPAPAFFRWRTAKLAAIFRAHYPASTPITEVGCGLGKNLITLAAAGYTQLAGLDPASEAVEAVREQAHWFGQSWQTGNFDLLDPDPAILDTMAGRILFTNHVIEQLPGRAAQALDCLLRARPAEVIHIEPCAELLRPARRLEDLASWLHIVAADYQRELLTTVNSLVTAGQALILETRLLGYSPRMINAPALIRWRPADKTKTAP
jgi:SAM-dependent methyltransferase